MEKYNLLIELNRKLSSGEDISAFEKENAVFVFLKEICPKEELFKFKKRMRVNPYTDNMYPYFYIPPYNGGKKLRLIQGYLPKTYICMPITTNWRYCGCCTCLRRRMKSLVVW